jgi:hypothetical protein
MRIHTSGDRARPSKSHGVEFVLFLFILLASLNWVAGCGFIRFPYSGLSPTPDFSITVDPPSSTVLAGSPGPSYSLTVTPIGAFSSAVSVALQLPTGFRCVPASCSVTLTPDTAAGTVQVTPASSTAPGSYQLNFVATSGTLTHTVSTTLVVQQTLSPDFSFTVSPLASILSAGASGPTYSFSATLINQFAGTILVAAAPPAGFTCVPVSCTATLVNNLAVNALQIQPPVGASGTYTIPFTATSGALSHGAVATITIPVALPPPAEICAVPPATSTPSSTRSGFVYTGDPSPTSIVFDSARNRILVSNLQLNEVDVISPETLSIMERLPVPQPMGIDLSADGKTLYIGTRTHYFYRAAADTLCLTDREYTIGFAPYTTLSPEYPTALADGSVLFAAYDVASTAQEVLLWTEANGFNSVAGLGPLTYSVRNIIPSGDRMHAYLSGDDSGGAFARYDVGTGAMSKTVAFGTQPTILAVKQDGSRVLILEDCCGVVLADSNFNTIASASGTFLSRTSAESDFSKFYVKNYSTPGIVVLDSALNPIGSLPAAMPLVDYAPQGLGPFDGQHRIVSVTPTGVALQPTSPIGPLLPANASGPALQASGAVYGAFRPGDPENGLATTLNGSSFPSAPTSVFLSEATTSQSAQITNYVASEDMVDLIVPSFASGCADVGADFAVGVQAFAPMAFCYSPAVFVIDGDSGPTTGGSTLTLTGMGFGPSPQVRIGGVVSSEVTPTSAYAASGPLAFSILKVTVPPGAIGDADIDIVTSWATTTLPHAFHYAQRQDTALPAGATPSQLLLDSARNRVLLTDSTHNQLLVYDFPSGALLNTIPTGPDPQGIAITPDGSHVVLLTAGDRMVTLLDAGTYQQVQQVTSPSTANIPFEQSPVGPPVVVATMAGNKAYIVTQAGYLQGGSKPYSYPALFDYDLNANTLTSEVVNSSSFGSGGGYFVASSLDGSTALVGSSISRAVGGALVGPDDGIANDYDPSVAPDGHVVASDGVFRDTANRWQNSTTADASIQPSSALNESFFDGAQFNGSGSLYFRSTATHIRIYDVNHGGLIRTLEVPGGLTGSIGTDTTTATRLLAVSPSGQQVVAATARGVSFFTFASAPLSIGEIKQNAGQIQLLGSGFSTVSGVLIDSIAVAANYVDSTEITLALPDLPVGTHSVTVTNPDGESYTLAMAFSIP